MGQEVDDAPDATRLVRLQQLEEVTRGAGNHHRMTVQDEVLRARFRRQIFAGDVGHLN